MFIARARKAVSNKGVILLWMNPVEFNAVRISTAPVLEPIHQALRDFDLVHLNPEKLEGESEDRFNASIIAPEFSIVLFSLFP